MRWASVASMENTTGARPEAQDREFDVVVLGATGVAGRLIAQRLVDLETGADGAGTARWAIAGRDPQRLQDLAQRLSRPLLPIVPADTTDPASLRALVRRTRVLLSAAGPYLPTAEAVIGACVEAGTSYLDLSGEIPLLRRVDDRFDSAARDAGVSIVQMAGWEALPADVVCLVAAHRALGEQSPATGAGGDIETVDVGVRFPRLPAGGVALKDAISGGTMGSLATQLRDRDARLIRDPASLLPPTGDRPAVHARSPLRLLPHIQAGRVMAPAVPVAFLNPPTVHRTAALLAAAAGTAHRPARFREGIDVGPATGTGGALRRVGAAPAAALQRLLLTAALLPRPLRRVIASIAIRAVPSGSGPTGAALTDWSWEVSADAATVDGARGRAVLRGTGHPGYTATATMIVAAALRLAHDRDEIPTGCITPALVFGVRGAEALQGPDLQLDD